MIDIHPPEHTPHSWRDFFIHIATIVVGLCIAVGLEQSVEAIHNSHERHNLLHTLHAESGENIEVLGRDLTMLRGGLAWNHAVAKLLRDATPHSGIITVTLPARPRESIETVSRSAWTVATSSGKTALLPENLAEVFDRVNFIAQHWNDVVDPYTSSIVTLQDFETQDGPVFFSGAPLHLTVAQRDDVLKLLGNNSTQLHQLLFWSAIWQGASQAVVDGVQTRDAIQPYTIKARQVLGG
jgi:hypothetical protein